jgi:hypothetical protein
MSLANQIRDNQQAAAATQQALRNNRRVVRRQIEAVADAEAQTDSPIAVVASNHPVVLDTAAALPSVITELPHTAITLSPLDLPTEQFSTGLARRKQNRQLLLDWLRTALVDGVDFGRVHIASKDKCSLAKAGRAKECTNQYHWSKPCLFKPGAEKITGMLGMTVHYPSLSAYETAVLAQNPISVILMRCELHDAQGHVVAEGVGARSLSQDYVDINKSLKMAVKSAHIDATLRLAGLSEVFTQDLEDRPVTDAEDAATASVTNAPPPKTTGGPTAPRSSSRKSTTDQTSATASATSPSPSQTTPLATTASTTAAANGNRQDIADVRARIQHYGFTEQRVLAWLYKTTQGQVTQFAQLSLPQCVSLLSKLDQWAEAENVQPHTDAKEDQS